MPSKEKIVLAAIIALFAFVLFRFYHYLGDRKSGHDAYPVGSDESGKCPDLNMWGLKWSVLLVMCAFNAILLAYLVTLNSA